MRNYAFTGRPLGLVNSREPSHAPRTPQKECVFCKIASSSGHENNGGRNNKLVFSSEKLVVFDDHRPAATRHFLVCPKAHIDGLYDLDGEEDLELLDEMIRVGEKVVLEAAAARAAAAEAAQATTSTSGAPPPSPPPPPPLPLRLKLGFHIPPWNSVDHLHLHAFLLPHTGGLGQRIRFAGTPGKRAGLWYASAGQVRARIVARIERQKAKAKTAK